MRLLFITWDGPQVSYLESLFLPIFRALQPHGIHTDVLQFRWGDADLTEAAALLCQANGIGYRAVPVLHRLGGAGAVATALAGGWHVRQVKRHFGSNILMPRSLMPALSVLVAGTRGAPILFDADGLAADERVDFAGLAKTSVTYRVLRRIEVAMARAATAVIVRSAAAADILARRADVDRSRFHVVTNGRDEDIFTPSSANERSATRKVLGIPETAPLMVYAGSVGPQYRFDRMVATALAVRTSRPDARLLVLSVSPDEALAELRKANPPVLEMTTVLRASPEAVPSYLSAGDVGFAFRSRSFSTQAIAPIKVGEYLLCGLPVIGTSLVGDTSAAQAAGVFFDDQSGADGAAAWLLGAVLPARSCIREAAREIGVQHFSLRRSIDDYLRALDPFRRPVAG